MREGGDAAAPLSAERCARDRMSTLRSLAVPQRLFDARLEAPQGTRHRA